MMRTDALPVPDWLRRTVRRLPVSPPSMLVARALNVLWWPLLGASARAELAGHVVELQVTDLGVVLRLVADPHGLRSAPTHRAAAAPAVRLKANALVYWQLLQGRLDPDTLFFDRRLVMEGDTEFGLLLKNTLDAVGPPRWPPSRVPPV